MFVLQNATGSAYVFRVLKSGKLQMETAGSSGGIEINDTQIYRSAADTLRTPDALVVDTTLDAAGAVNLASSSGNAALVVGGGNVGIGASASTFIKLRVSGTVTASSGHAMGTAYANTLTAAANSDILAVHSVGNTIIAPVFAKGAFTGLLGYGIYVRGDQFSATGTGTLASVAAGYFRTPSIGTVNYALEVVGRIRYDETETTTNLTAARKVPININGTVRYMLLSDGP